MYVVLRDFGCSVQRTTKWKRKCYYFAFAVTFYYGPRAG